MTVGPIPGTLIAIGRELDRVGGHAMTRLTSVVAVGDTVWPVESTLLFPASGSFVARGTLYTYLSKTPVTLSGVQYTDGVTVFNGAKIDIPTESSVTDYSRSRTAIDRLRRATLVNYADGRDLDVVGRNLGVPRLPGIASDAVYRAIVKALAYNPKGTIYGIRLVLEAILGAGNFAIYEDLISRPNRIFVQLLGGATTTTSFLGKAFLNQTALRPMDTGTQLTLSGPPSIETVYSVVFKDQDHLSDFRNQLPSAETLFEYPGDPGAPAWSYVGPNEGLDVTQVSGLYIEIDDSSAIDLALYLHEAPVQPESTARLSVLQTPTSGATISGTATDAAQWHGAIFDGARILAWGILANGAAYDIGFLDYTAGTFIGAAVVTAQPVNTFIDIELRKDGVGPVELFIDGAKVGETAYTNFPVGSDTQFQFGAGDDSVNTMIGRVKQVSFFSTTPVDYWAARGVNGQAFPATTSDKTFDDVTAAAFVSGDVGKKITVSGGVTANPQGGRNNGEYEVATFVSASRVTLRGRDRAVGFVQTATPTTFFAGDPQAFKFPDDLGKAIVISGSTNNDGTYIITDMISESDGVTSLLTGFDSQIAEKTGIVKASAASFVTETNLTWRLDPVFVNETGLSWELSDAGSETAGVLTLRQPVTSGDVMLVRYTDVLSAQLLANAVIANTFVGPGVFDYSYYPFYLTDPLGVVRSYLDLITVGGVIPDLKE